MSELDRGGIAGRKEGGTEGMIEDGTEGEIKEGIDVEIKGGTPPVFEYTRETLGSHLFPFVFGTSESFCKTVFRLTYNEDTGSPGSKMANTSGSQLRIQITP